MDEGISAENEGSGIALLGPCREVEEDFGGGEVVPAVMRIFFQSAGNGLELGFQGFQV